MLLNENELSALINEIDPRIQVSEVSFLSDALASLDLITQLRSRSKLFATFAVIGLSIAVLGVSGAASYSAALRRRETGIRLALGATRGRTITDMTRELLIPLLVGIGIGTESSVNLAWPLEGYLFEAEPLDSPVLIAVAGCLTAVVLLAYAVALWRGTTVDPAECLRSA